MIKRSSFLKKLASYSALASSALVAPDASGQILYHKITPHDTLHSHKLNGGTYYIDLQGDGFHDFYVSAKSDARVSSERSIFYFNASINDVSKADRIEAEGHYISLLQSGQSIGKKGNWKNDYGGRLFAIEGSSGNYSFFERGYWKNATDKLAGLRIRNTTTGDFNYGWVQLSVKFKQSLFGVHDDTASAVVEDYAYEETPNKPIIAGDMGTCMPAVSLFASGHKTFPVGDSATLNVLGYRKGDVITWFRNDETIKTDSDKSLVAKEHGLYSALVKNKDGCGQVTDTIQIKTFMPKNSPEVMDQSSTLLSDLYVYNKTLFGRLHSKDMDQSFVIIYNELGQEELKQNISAGIFTIHLQSLVTGVYFVQLLNGGKTEGKKIFVE